MSKDFLKKQKKKTKKNLLIPFLILGGSNEIRFFKLWKMRFFLFKQRFCDNFFLLKKKNHFFVWFISTFQFLIVWKADKSRKKNPKILLWFTSLIKKELFLTFFFIAFDKRSLCVFNWTLQFIGSSRPAKIKLNF